MIYALWRFAPLDLVSLPINNFHFFFKSKISNTQKRSNFQMSAFSFEDETSKITNDMFDQINPSYIAHTFHRFVAIVAF